MFTRGLHISETFRYRSHFHLLPIATVVEFSKINHERNVSLLELIMKKAMLLNAEVSQVIARLGHTDRLVIADAGLPIPDTTQRIDLALTHGVPTFLQVFAVITDEMQVEHALLAEEIKQHNPGLHEALLKQLKQLEQHQGNTITLEYVSHQAFKQQTQTSRAVIRSGECSPFANIILCAGVTF